MDIVSYALSKKYTEDTVIGLGFLKGANCTIKSVTKEDGINTVVFEWTATDGTIKTTEMKVYDGTPIYAWTSGESYKVGDLAIYGTNLYKCIVPNSDIVFNNNKWQIIGGGSGGDSNYGIVETVDLLPNIFTIDDRKMYYVISESVFYLWNGVQWQIQKNKVVATYSNENLILE